MKTQKRKINELRHALKTAWEPPKDLLVSEFADEHRQLSSESSSERGRWVTARAEYQRGMMDAVNDPDTKIVVCKIASQTGKTEVVNNIAQYFMVNDPCAMILMQPTTKMVKTYSRNRLKPMIRDTKILRELFEANGKDAVDTLEEKTYPGGVLYMVTANSPADLASRPARIILNDEIDRYPHSSGGEGNPVDLLWTRSVTYWNRKMYLISSPTDEHSEISKWFERSDKRYFYVPCPHCGVHFRLMFEKGVIEIPKNEQGERLYDETHAVCTNGCVIEEHHQKAMVRKGVWRSTNTENAQKGVVGFQLSQLYSPWVKWSDLARDFFACYKDPERLRVFKNTKLAEVYKHEGDKAALEEDQLLQLRDSYTIDEIPNDVLFLTAGVDVQGDHLQVLINGWGEWKSRKVFGKIFVWGDPLLEDTWAELDEVLFKKYGDFKISSTVIDTGGKKGVTEVAYSYCKPRQQHRIFAGKGSSQPYQPIASRGSIVGHSRVQLFLIGTDTAKDLLFFNYLPNGKVSFSSDTTDSDLKELLAEERVQPDPENKPDHYEYKSVAERNEMLDLLVYNEAAYVILQPDIPAIKSNLAAMRGERGDSGGDSEPELIPTTRNRRSQSYVRQAMAMRRRAR